MPNEMTVKKNTVKIRMYKTGFGDCFLLAFPVPNKKPKYMLVDCGVHHSTSNRKEIMNKVAQSIKDATNGKIHLLVVTHEHTDHIEGFKLAKDIFENIEIENVWMGWTENYEDPRVKEMDKKFTLYLNALKIARDQINRFDSSLVEKLDNLLGFYGEELGFSGKMTNRKTMKWLQDKAKSDLKYCLPGGKPLTLDGIKDPRFYVLGPPTTWELIRKSTPSRGSKKETYLTDPDNDYLDEFALKVLEKFDPGKFNLHKEELSPLTSGYPFDRSFLAKDKEKRESKNIYKKLYFDNDNKWRCIEDRWLDLAGELALKLDSHTNNTSLVLAIELSPSGKVVLLAADAQVGNWLGWEDLTWTVDGKTITSDDLLKRTVLYKVGHHASHNATLKEKGLEKMTSDELTAMISVDEVFAREKKKWPIPHKHLLKELKDRCKERVIRSDLEIPGKSDRPHNLNVQQWKEFTDRVKEKELYTEYVIKI